MARLSQDQKSSLRDKLWGLRVHVDTATIDVLLDEILMHIDRLEVVTCTLTAEAFLCLQTPDETIAEVELPRAKAMLRLLCARLAVRASKWAGREVSPYGDIIDFELPCTKQHCRVRFQNTPESQQFEILQRTAASACRTAVPQHM